MPSASRVINKTSSVTALLISLIILNTAGIVILYVKTDLDAQSTSQEVGIIRKQEEASYINNQVQQKTRNIVNGFRPPDGTVVDTWNKEEYRLLAQSLDGHLLLLGLGVCPGSYRVSNPIIGEDAKSATYVWTYQLASNVQSIEMGRATFSALNDPKAQFITSRSLDKTLELPECQVFISPAP